MTIVFRAETKGGRYRTEVAEEDDGTFSHSSYTRGVRQGRGVGYSKKQMGAWIFQHINTSRLLDKIDLRVKQDLFSWMG